MNTTRRTTILAVAAMALAPLAAGPALATDCMTQSCAAADPHARDHRTRVRDHRTRDQRPNTRVNAERGRVRYTLWNDSGQDVSFRLPTGRSYRLRPGQRGEYTSSGDGPLTILVHNSGRKYTLKSGNHRFWWMASETRVGLDLNYR